MARHFSNALGLLPVGVAMLFAASAIAQDKGGMTKADASRWQGAFGSMPMAATEDDEIPAETSKEHEAALAALGEIGSFPLKVHSGDEGGSYWTDATLRSFVPQPTARKFKVGECQFEIKTGALSARQYSSDTPGTFAVKQDAISPQTTLMASDVTPTYVSVTSELYATVLGNRNTACKAMLKDKRKKIGRIDLEETTLVLTADDERKFPAGQVRGAEGTMIYLSWSDDTASLKLEDRTGLAPSVESPIFEIKPQVGGDLYLEVTPRLTMKRMAAAADHKPSISPRVAGR